jgi:hypothetical protein
MGKRKAEEELSGNKNTKKERARRERASELQREYERRRHADHTREKRAVDKLKRTSDYQSAGKDRRNALITSCKERVRQQL